MKKKLLTILAVGMLAGPMAANAIPYSFSYTFGGGSVLAGSFDGILQGDNDTVFISSFGPVVFAGVTLSSIDASDFRSISDFPTGALQPLVSISGTRMDLGVCSQGFTRDGGTNCDFANEGGFALGSFESYRSAFAGTGLGYWNSEAFDSARWNLRSTSVPEPATLALFSLGLLGLGFSRRRKLN